MSKEKRCSAGDILHAVFSYGILLLWGLSNLYRGITRFVGLTSYPYQDRPVHLIILIAGLLETALGVFQLCVRRSLIRGDADALRKLDASLILCLFRLVAWELMFRFLLDVPASAFRSGFWFQLALAAVGGALLHLFYRKRLPRSFAT